MRTVAAQELADRIRAEHGFKGYVITMSGTPSPKSPLDIWALAEVTYLASSRKAALRRSSNE